MWEAPDMAQNADFHINRIACEDYLLNIRFV